ncbi:IucA/IucC family protein [Streptomyces klenkii]|uniref:Iron transporter n=1 Tax=Streptomyces klenkii TaxID=1420899 RepID=A0A3B0AYT9_9ACTN|nr:IucA/IucC family protein [Streptomyces klenkii]RKN65623.1 iron transporter [Streptomyces klenkii]
MSSSAPLATTPATCPPAVPGVPTADHVVAHTLLNCLLREVSGPEHQTAVSDGHLLLRLPRTGDLLRVRLRRASLIGAHRFTGAVTVQRDGGWAELPWRALAELIHRELRLRTGVRNEEFLDQVASSHAGVSAALAARRPAADEPAGADRYVDSEQSLLYGHRFHPTPKARTGAAEDWGRYAPEARARFALRHLAVRRELVREEAATPTALAALDRQGSVPEGYVLLPAHPWQYGMFRDHPLLRAAAGRGDVIDLGERGPAFAPTASVRTLYDGKDFLKFSLNIRITNCLRKNSEYELTGAVALTRLLEPAAAGLAARFPGAELLREPGYRTLDLGSRELAEAFGVIVREGLGARLAPDLTALLAGAVADEYPTGAAQISRLLAGTGPETALAWWDAYLGLLVPPVLAAYFDHGIVLEPHLQNVVVGVDGSGMPRQVLLRDLEGTKLLPEHHAEALAGLGDDVARPMTYDRERGWDRVVYCLVVNHLAEMLAALADRHPRLEPELWSALRRVLAARSAAHGNPPLLRALVAGVPLPAKANLLTRWERKADRHAGYVRIGSPLVSDLLSEATRTAPWSTAS